MRRDAQSGEGQALLAQTPPGDWQEVFVLVWIQWPRGDKLHWNFWIRIVRSQPDDEKLNTN